MNSSSRTVPASIPAHPADSSPGAWLASLIASETDPCKLVPSAGIFKIPDCAAE